MDRPTASGGTIASFDWSKCIFCQQISKTCSLTCPAKSKRNDVGCGYKYMAEELSIESLRKEEETRIRAFETKHSHQITISWKAKETNEWVVQQARVQRSRSAAGAK